MTWHPACSGVAQVATLLVVISAALAGCGEAADARARADSIADEVDASTAVADEGDVGDEPTDVRPDDVASDPPSDVDDTTDASDIRYWECDGCEEYPPVPLCPRPNGGEIVCLWLPGAVDCPARTTEGVDLTPDPAECAPFRAYPGAPWETDAIRAVHERQDDFRAIPGPDLGVEAASSLECHLGTGCPEPLRVIESGIDYYPDFTADGSRVHVELFGALAGFDEEGAYIGRHSAMAIRTVTDLPGDRGVLVDGGTYHNPPTFDDPHQEACTTHRFLTRLDADYEPLWTLPVPNAVSPIVFEATNEVAVVLNPYRCPTHNDASACVVFVGFFDLDTGERRGCAEIEFYRSMDQEPEGSSIPWRGTVTLPDGVRALGRTREHMLYFDSSTHEVRAEPIPLWYRSRYADVEPSFLPDGNMMLRSAGGFHILDPDLNVVWEDFFVEPRQPGDTEPAPYVFDTRAPYVIGYDGTIYLGVIPYGVLVYRGDWNEGETFMRVSPDPFTRGDPVAVMEDGTILFRDDSGVKAFEPRTLRVLWTISSETGLVPAVVLDDGTLVISNIEGRIEWWRTSHGRVGNTPRPAGRTSHDGRRLAPANPILGEPERERTWRWPEEVAEGSGDAP